MAATFREVIADTLDDMSQRENEPWTPEADQSSETFLTLHQDLLGSAPVLASDLTQPTFAEALLTAEGLPVLTPQSIPAANLELYALTIGNTPGSRAAFVRRANPRRGLRAGRLLTSLSDTLTRIDEPVFGFDLNIDLIFVGERVHVLSQSTFRALFRDQEALTAQVPAWTGDLAGHLPISQAGLDRLAAKALRDRRIASRLETIVNRGHLDGITSDRIRETMTQVGLDPDVLLTDAGELEFADEHIPTVLQFLNEDLFYGAITNVGFRADKKAAR
ncbi:hypothetical protein [Nocardioides mesophilus]|uniref:DUF4868 domain-containing protein n=1 Tax=Nocardioides mesophilus TaxID=433659 RepID=A0A7G9R9N9_9ACTN|nr:hypothetical protein [Nocardioides mesophilus]QNN52314.1 hypothetical protein H9L09_17790 [Nocardioides mesophilus]